MVTKVVLGQTNEKFGTPSDGVIDIEELLATRLLVQGNSGSGKSHLLRRLLEQSAPFVQQIIIDPEGDFVSLSERYNHIVVDANRSETEIATIAERVRQHRVSTVFNLEHLDVEMQMRAAGIFLNALFDQPREFWYPVLIVVDESQLFAPSAAGEVSEEARRTSLGAMTNLMCRGRKRGLAGIIATQRLAKLAKNVAAEASNFLMGRTYLDIDMARAADLLGVDRTKAEVFRDLGRGEFMALGPALSRKPVPIKVGSVETSPRGYTPQLTPPPTSDNTEDLQQMIFAKPEISTGRTKIAAAAKPDPIESVLSIVDQAAPSALNGSKTDESDSASASTEMADVDEQKTASDKAMRQAIFDVIHDDGATSKPEQQQYAEFRAFCRVRAIKGTPFPLEQFRRNALIARAGVSPDLDEDLEWQRAMEVANKLSDELLPIYLKIAHAAHRKEPAPRDEDIATVCGTHSIRRGRSRLELLEKDSYIVIQTDLQKHRVMRLPDLGWETSKGQP